MEKERATANALLRLQESLQQWMIRNQVATDTQFYDSVEWQKRGEKYHTTAALVLVFESGLFTLLNYGGDTKEFDDLIASFGFSYELGYAWSMGFYPLDALIER